MVWGDTNWATTTTPLFGSADAPPYAVSITTRIKKTN